MVEWIGKGGGNVAKDKLQFVFESFFLIRLSLFTIFICLYYDSINIALISVAALFLSMYIFSILKAKEKWFKAKSRLSKGTNVIFAVLFSVISILAREGILPLYSNIVIMLLFALIAIFIDYRFNFKTQSE